MKMIFRKVIQLIAMEFAQIAIVRIADRFLGEKNMPNPRVENKGKTENIQEIDATKNR